MPQAPLDYPVHIVIPDTQVSPEHPYDHLGWIGRYIRDRYEGRHNVTVIHLGDHWDMPSLSSYDKGKRAMEGRRIYDDLKAGNEAFARLDEPLDWDVRKVFLMGNHEERLVRATDNDAQLHGVLSLDDFNTLDWEWYPFLEPVCIDGVYYAHYFYNSMNGRPIAGMIETRIKNIGHSFTQGHQQTLMYGVRPVLRGFHHGLVAGACYMHDETYKGPQGNDHWRGIIVCNEVRDGNYDPMFVSLDYLCRRFEGVTLAKFYKR